MSVGEFLWGAFGPAIGFIAIILVISFLSEQANKQQAKQDEFKKRWKAEQEEKNRKLQEAWKKMQAERQNPWYPGQYLGHVNYNDNKRMQDILKEIEAKGEWPCNPKK